MNPSRNLGVTSRRTTGILPAVAAIGSVCVLAATPASAIELGELRMESTLGQPLRASIAYALSPNETLYDFCIALTAPQSGGPIPSVTRANVTVTGNTIILTGNAVVKDPLLNVRIAIDCPYTPHLVREYTMIIDPVLPETQNVVVADAPAPDVPSQSAAPIATASQTAAPVAARPQPEVAESPLSMNTEYRVQNGDTISAIAARVEGRTIGLWDAVGNLIATNPDAFLEGDANQLVSGSVLFIPDLTAVTTLSAGESFPESAAPASNFETDLAEETNAFFAPEPVEEPAIVESVAEPVATPVADTPETAVVEPEPTAVVAEPVAAVPEPVAEAPLPVAEEPEPVLEAAAPVTESLPEEPTVADAFEDVADVADQPIAEFPSEASSDAETGMRPGDVVVAAPAPAENVPATTPIVRSSESAGTESSWSWIFWLAAGGAALLLAGGVFWGRLRDLFGSRAINEPAAAPAELPDDEETVTSTIIDDVDFEFNDGVTTESLSLDADLDAGTGLQDGEELDVAQDFGFEGAADTGSHVDLELPEEAAREPEKHHTDIIPPSHKAEESSILEAEIEPSDEEYDMSMIVDATKQSMDEDDLTAQDLHAVPVGDQGVAEDYSVDDGTLATEMDLQALEQDYEEEFTQTQAINKEIEQAAAELAQTLAAQDSEQNVTEVDFELEPTAVAPSVPDGQGTDPTAEMPSGGTPVDVDLTAAMPAVDQETGLQPTVEMPARQFDPGLEPTVEMSLTEDDSGTHPELTANIPVDAEALNDDVADNDITSKLTAAGSDVTVEMEVETGSVDTKKDSE